MSPPYIDPDERAAMAWECASINDEPVDRATWLKIVAGVARMAAAAERDACARMWKPIETAPKDGTRVLVWHQNWFAASTAQWYGDWWGLVYEVGPFAYQPTHWMPLPAPPTTNTE